MIVLLSIEYDLINLIYASERLRKELEYIHVDMYILIYVFSQAYSKQYICSYIDAILHTSSFISQPFLCAYSRQSKWSFLIAFIHTYSHLG